MVARRGVGASQAASERRKSSAASRAMAGAMQGSVPSVAVEQAHATRGAGLAADGYTLREGVVELHQVLGGGAERLLEAQVELVRKALAEGDHVGRRVGGGGGALHVARAAH